MFFTFLINKHFVFFFLFFRCTFLCIFWIILSFGFLFYFSCLIFAADASEICQQTDAERKPFKCFSWHRVASLRVEGGPTRNQQQQLRHKQRPRNDADCDWGSGQQQRPRQLIRQREIFLCFFLGESRAHGRQTYALSFSLFGSTINYLMKL